MRIVFMGSPGLAVPALQAVLEAGHVLPLVVTQAPRPAGRGLRAREPAVALAARDAGLPVYQPESLRDEAARQPIEASRPDAILVVAYGRLLPASLLAVPTLGCLNVHLSLLPRHRGAAPVSGAILTGDVVTGVSVMVMEERLDTGPVLAQAPTPLEPSDDQVSLTARLATMGAELLVTTLEQWQAGTIRPIPQDESAATWTHPTKREDARLDWREPAEKLWRAVRAYAEWPQGYTRWNGKLLRILTADFDPSATLEPGLVQAWDSPRKRSAVAVGTGQGVLLPRVLGLEGRRTLPVDAFLRGQPALLGARLRSEPGDD